MSNASDFTIRHALRADTPALGKLGTLMVKTHYDFDPKRFIAPSFNTEFGYGSFLSSQIGDTSRIVLVAERDGKVVGYSYSGVEGFDYMSLRGPAGVLYDIVVNPEYRGAGIGTQLLKATLEELDARLVPRVLLSTAEQNEAAQRLFTRAGFRRTMIEMTRERPE